jgi:hypothetical protein
VTLEGGVRLKNVAKGKSPVAFTYEELHKMYADFEAKRIEKAMALVGNRSIKPDHFCKFLVTRTDFCPHRLLDSSSSYWLETITLLDGEQGVTLPAAMGDIPIIFFDALSVVRTSRAQARKEDKKE